MAQYAITDIHGCLHTLRAMIEKVLPKYHDNKYYFLGDYINKGPNSKGVLDYLMVFAQKNHCRFLRGNHDQMLLDYLSGMQLTAPQFTLLEKTSESFEKVSFRALPSVYFEFINRTEWYIELPNFLLVHAGFNFDLPNIFLDKKSMLNTKSMNYDAIKALHKKIVRGHIPNNIAYLKEELFTNSPIISLDTGCVYKQNEELGVLTAMDLNTLQLYHQPNIEPAYFIERR